MPTYRKYLFISLLLLSSCAQAQSVPANNLPPEILSKCDWQTVDTVIDGDTVKLTNALHVRYVGIDTPELFKEQIESFAEAAKDENEKLVTNQTVCLVQDPIGDNIDKYQRLVRYIYLPDATLVNKKLIEDGVAEAYTAFPFEKKDEFLESQRQAKENKVGIWGQASLQADTNANTNSQTFIPLEELGKHMGEYVTLSFTIESSHDTGKVTFLNSSKSYKDPANFNIVIFASAKKDFAAAGVTNIAKYYVHKKIVVQGKIKEYQKKPEMIIARPEDIQVIPND